MKRASSSAIAAETEAIELLLKSKKINPRGGGGGGANPGGGGGGTTNDSALALLGAGLNEKEVREDLEKQRRELLATKQTLIAENKKRKDDLASLDEQLKKFSMYTFRPFTQYIANIYIVEVYHQFAPINS